MNYLKALLPAILLLASCANPPVQPTYDEYQERYPENEPFERVIFNFKEACNDEGMCYVKQAIIDAAATVITELNNTVENLNKEANEKRDAFIDCKMSKDELSQALWYRQQEAKEEKYLGTAKTLGSVVIGALICR